MAFIQVASRPQLRPAYAGGGGGGNFVDNAGAFITGSSFSTNPATQVSIKADCESASVGTNLYDIAALSSSGWANANGTEGTGRRTQVTNSTCVFGTKSFQAAVQTPGSGTFGVSRDFGSTLSSVLIHDYIRLDYAGASGGQWKMMRINGDGKVTDDAVAGLYFANWFGTGPGDFAYSALPGGTGWETGHGGVPDLIYSQPFNAWCEREIYLNASSGTGVSDGTLEYRLWLVSNGSVLCNYSNSTLNAFPDSNRWRYFPIYQNYQGNGDFDSVATTARFDDPVIMYGNQMCLYAADASTWAACTKRVPQLWTSGNWTNTRIDFTFRQGNLGTLSTSNIWFYVRAANGSVNSSGYTGTPQ